MKRLCVRGIATQARVGDAMSKDYIYAVASLDPGDPSVVDTEAQTRRMTARSAKIRAYREQVWPRTIVARSSPRPWFWQGRGGTVQGGPCRKAPARDFDIILSGLSQPLSHRALQGFRW